MSTLVTVMSARETSFDDIRIKKIAEALISETKGFIDTFFPGFTSIK